MIVNVKIILSLLPLFLIILAPFSTNVFAEESYDILIPTGAASPDAPYFWQSEKDGSTTGVITILTGDTVVWKNADTAAHTVTSGTALDGPDDIFDSGLFGPGKSFIQSFSEEGTFPYFCLVHPWMDGEVIVSAGYSIIPQIGVKAGDGKTSFDVEYDFNRLLSELSIDEEQKSITFEITGNAKSDHNILELLLPTGLIDGPFVIWVDDEMISEFEQTIDGDINILQIDVAPEAKLLTIVGTSVVPEFGQIAMLILGISVISMIILSRRIISNSISV